MIATRESIYAALLALVQNVTGAVTVSRIPFPEASLSGVSLPAIEQLPAQEDALDRGLNLAPKWQIRQPLAIYVDTSGPDVVGDTALNNMLDALETAFKPSPATGYQTLGGLVTSCKLKGVLMKDAGYQSTFGAALVLFEIVTTS